MGKLSEKLSGIRVNLAFDNWPLLLMQRIFFRSVSATIYKRGELVFLTDFEGGDAMGVRHLLTADMYSRHFSRIDPVVPGELTVLDLGANNGGFVFCLHDSGLRISQAVCVEMNPHTYSRLLYNVDRNFAHTVKAINAAVTGDGNSVEIVDSRGSTGQSIYAGDKGSSGQKIQVPGITLDELVIRHFGSGDKNLDIAKIDIEGAEFDVLLADNADSLRRFRNLFIEIHPHSSRSRTELVEKIRSLGFRRMNTPESDSGAGEGDDAEVFFFQRATV